MRYTIDMPHVIFYRKKVEADTIKQLLDAAIHAPSALHEESRGFVIIQNKNLLDRISESAKLIINNESNNNKNLQSQHVFEVVQQKEFNIFYNAHTLIVIYSIFKGPFVKADCWLVAQNLMLAALPLVSSPVLLVLQSQPYIYLNGRRS